jgi:voltage-gated sodium channel
MTLEQEVCRYVKLWKRAVIASGNPIPIDKGYEDEEPEPVEFVDSTYFNLLVGVIIIVNVASIGIEMDLRTSGRDTSYFQFIELGFLVLYTTELLLRLRIHGIEFFFQPGVEHWNRLDAFIVITSWLDYLFLAPNEQGGFKVLSTLRFLRNYRLLRLLRLLRFFKELLLLAFAVLNSMRILFCFVVILVFLMVCVAVFTGTLVGQDNEYYDARYKEIQPFDHEAYFGTIPLSIVTLTQLLTLDNGSYDLVFRRVFAEDVGVGILISVFIAVASFCILKGMIAVVVTEVLEIGKKYAVIRERMNKDRDKMIFNELADVFRAADANQSGALDLDEILEATNKPEIYNKMNMIDFPVHGLAEVFHVLDFDDSGELTIDEFVRGCERMRGHAKSKDLVEAQIAFDRMRKMMKTFEHELNMYVEKINTLTEVARGIMHQGEQVFLNQQEYRSRHKSHVKQRMKSIVLADDQLFATEDSDMEPHVHFHESDDGSANLETALEDFFAIENEDFHGKMTEFLQVEDVDVDRPWTAS